MSRAPQQGSSEGVRLAVREGKVYLDVAVVAGNGANLHELGQAVQRRVSEAFQWMVGMPVAEVNVYIDDVAE